MLPRKLVVGRRSLAACLIVSLLLAPGCGDEDVPESIPIQGKVTYKGQPVTQGEVVYTPVKPKSGPAKGRPARGRIRPDGTFVMATSPSVPGVVAGDYEISIVAIDAGSPSSSGPNSDPVARPADDEARRKHSQSIVPDKYLRPKTSGLKDTVDENHPGTKDLALTD